MCLKDVEEGGWDKYGILWGKEEFRVSRLLKPVTCYRRIMHMKERKEITYDKPIHGNGAKVVSGR